jgi:hypothetical protein
MHPRIAAFVEHLHPAYERLISQDHCFHRSLPKGMPEQRVYLFSEAGRPLYVGRSRNLRTRYGCGSPTHDQAGGGSPATAVAPAIMRWSLRVLGLPSTQP